jgi:hypothetical protein
VADFGLSRVLQPKHVPKPEPPKDVRSPSLWASISRRNTNDSKGGGSAGKPKRSAFQSEGGRDARKDALDKGLRGREGRRAQTFIEGVFGGGGGKEQGNDYVSLGVGEASGSRCDADSQVEAGRGGRQNRSWSDDSGKKGGKKGKGGGHEDSFTSGASGASGNGAGAWGGSGRDHSGFNDGGHAGGGAGGNDDPLGGGSDDGGDDNDFYSRKAQKERKKMVFTRNVGTMLWAAPELLVCDAVQVRLPRQRTTEGDRGQQRTTAAT